MGNYSIADDLKLPFVPLNSGYGKRNKKEAFSFFGVSKKFSRISQ